jgi:hypothetical protein
MQSRTPLGIQCSSEVCFLCVRRERTIQAGFNIPQPTQHRLQRHTVQLQSPLRLLLFPFYIIPLKEIPRQRRPFRATFHTTVPKSSNTVAVLIRV